MSKKQHDRLCPVKDQQSCQCALIAAVEDRVTERLYESWSADLEHQRYH